MQTFNIVAKFAVCILVLILVEGFVTLGLAFEWSNYGPLGVLVQFCLIVLAFRVSVENWGED